MEKKLIISWNDVMQFIDSVEETYKSDSSISGVYGLPRGGLIFAVMISHRLNIPYLAAPAPGCIIVDDVCDSGESLLHYATNTSSPDKPKYHTVTMHLKPNKLVQPNYAHRLVDKDIWIVYPWEA